MSEFTAEEFRVAMIEHLSSHQVNGEWVGDDADDDYFSNYGYYYNSHQFELPGYGNVRTVEGQGMYQDTDEYMNSSTSWNVYFIVECQGRFFRFSGTADSWGGDEAVENNCEEVESVQQTILVWEKKLDY